jgi:predicted secreted hydrolase
MDHEFSSSFLEPGQVGWDWFALQMDNQHEIMLYQMRRSDGTADPFSSGTLVEPEGTATHLSRDDFVLTPLDTWRSPETQAEYPLNWQVEIPRLGYSLRVEPAFERQEMYTEATTGLQYWEGSIHISGRHKNAPVQGVGYLELTGYAGRSLGALFE